MCLEEIEAEISKLKQLFLFLTSTSSLETIFPQDTCIQQCFIHSQYGLQNSFFSKQTNTWPSNPSQSCRIFLKLKVVQRFVIL